MRYFLELAYEGTNYHGWQIQINALAVQEVVNQSLKALLRQDVETIGCGRTDTGVHALQFYLHFEVENEELESTSFCNRLNGILPDDIAVYRLIQVADDSHTRFSATLRSYEYHIHRLKDPFLSGRSYRVINPLDIDKMNEACQILMKHKDFASFCKAGSVVKTTLCRIEKAEWHQSGHRVVFSISADRFLRNMVRAIVGTMIDVGKGKITLEQFEEIIRSKDRKNAGISADACGLYLTKVQYPFL